MSTNKGKKSRMLKVEHMGDRCRKAVILQIRLKGKWLLLAGYQPEQHVLISNPEPGVLILRSL